MTSLSSVPDVGISRSPQSYGILNMSLKIIVVQGGRTHTVTKKKKLK